MMSQTRSIGVYDREYWSYTAAVMVDSLERVISSGRVSGDDVPRAIRQGAVRFFDLVMEGAGNEVPNTSFLAGINAYGIAVEAMGMSSQPFIESKTQIANRLNAYNQFTKNLEQSRKLTEAELQDARLLKDFFNELWQGGESEAYERVVEMDNSSPSESLH